MDPDVSGMIINASAAGLGHMSLWLQTGKLQHGRGILKASLGNSEGLGGDRQGPSLGKHGGSKMGICGGEHRSLFFQQHPSCCLVGAPPRGSSN